MGAYVSRTEVDAVLTYDLNVGTLWSALTNDEKDNYITFGEYLVDIIPGYHWLGAKVADDQANEWPRDGIVSQASEYASYDTAITQLTTALAAAEATESTIPTEIKRSVIETLRKAPTFDDFYKFKEMQASAVESFSVDVISFNFDLSKRWGRPLPPEAWRSCRYLMVGYWQDNSANMLQRL
jgi:hypothetical protein